MALVAGASRNALGDPDAGQVPLQVVANGSVAGFAVQDLPNVVEHAADVSNGNVIVVIGPMGRQPLLDAYAKRGEIEQGPRRAKYAAMARHRSRGSSEAGPARVPVAWPWRALGPFRGRRWLCSR
jgi:hypothetical protein